MINLIANSVGPGAGTRWILLYQVALYVLRPRTQISIHPDGLGTSCNQNYAFPFILFSLCSKPLLATLTRELQQKIDNIGRARPKFLMGIAGDRNSRASEGLPALSVKY